MGIMRSWHLDLNPKFYDICFYFEFFPLPDSKHWQLKLHQQIFGLAMTDPTLQWKKKSPQNYVWHFVFENSESPVYQNMTYQTFNITELNK